MYIIQYMFFFSQIESRNICVFLSGQVFILCSSDCTWSTFYDDFLSFCDRAAYGQIIQTIRDRAAIWSLKEFVLDLFLRIETEKGPGWRSVKGALSQTVNLYLWTSSPLHLH